MAEWFEEVFDDDYVKAYTRFADISKEDVDGLIDILSLKKELKILDLCCGYGRHSIELAKRGFSVTGYDLSEHLLKVARTRANEEGLDVKFIKGDMRDLDFDEEYDVVLNLFTSFGYFTHEENKEVLAKVLKALVPNGRFLIQALSFSGIIRRANPENQYNVAKDEGLTIVDHYDWDLVENIENVQRKLFFDDGRIREMNFSFKVYTLSEILRMIDEVGMSLVDYYGNLQGDPFTYDSAYYTIIAEKTP